MVERPMEKRRYMVCGLSNRAIHTYVRSVPPEAQRIAYLPLLGEPEIIDVKPLDGSHGGSDALLTEDLFRRSSQETPDPICIRATSREGAHAVAVGEAMWRSVKTGAPVAIASVVVEQ